MNISAPFIRRPIATILLVVAMVVTGVINYARLEVAPLPQMSIPFIAVSARLPGASPQTMATSVATPLQRSLGSIAGVKEMNASSSEGNTQVVLEFDISKDVNDAAREVQAAINKALPLMPSGMYEPPTYQKFNPSSVPVITLTMTSDTYGKDKLYDMASTVLSQKIAQVEGVADVDVGGSSMPAVRIDVDPAKLSAYHINLSELRNTIAQANQMRPRGYIANGDWRWQISTNGQMHNAAEFQELVVHWQEDQAVKLSDVAHVYDSVENEFNGGFFNNQDAIILTIRQEEGANIIKTVSAVKAQMAALQSLLPAGVDLAVGQDRTPSIRATLHETELTLIIATVLVVLVVLLFLRNYRATLIPAVAVPVSLLGTVTVMHFMDFSLNNISLMALIVATGFVVDDSIVVVENIVRYLEMGHKPKDAALKGAKEVGFTVISISLSLVVVFLPLILVGGLVGNLFYEFAMTMSVAVMVSLVISLTLTPMMCAYWLKLENLQNPKQNPVLDGFHYYFEWFFAAYKKTLGLAIKHRFLTLMSLLAAIALNVLLFMLVPKGLLPQQDTGVVMGIFRADKGTSFESAVPKLDQYRKIIGKNPNVATVMGYVSGRGGNNRSFLLIQLEPFGQRIASAQDVINELNQELGKVSGTRMFLVPQQDIQAGGGRGPAAGEYTYTLKSGDLELLNEWVPKVTEAFKELPELVGVNGGGDDKGYRLEISIDRDKVARLGLSMSSITDSLNSLYSQRQISRMYDDLNQYNVVLGADKIYARSQRDLEDLVLLTADGRQVPLSSIARTQVRNAPLSIHQKDGMLRESIDFALAPNVSLDQASKAIDEALLRIKLPTKQILAGFDGNALLFQQMSQQQPLMLLGVLALLYLLFGILYESYAHPLTILSTLPSAGLGAFIALMAFRMEFTLIALIGVFLLIGIVKKNAIMLIDFTLHKQRQDKISAEQAVYEGCLVRFRPIMMTTMAAMLGAFPLIIATGAGVEMRQPLGVVIVGGLIVSQILTLYTTPVVYIYLDKMASAIRQRFKIFAKE
ncbi:efflux RND transporter permease subunit [Brackiella oedipodis]|uniref:efflux RND transporter permease subunit n=1 Tax=Brackiella oedipodis TaxID=124225 RepID=UPI000490DDA5|nr:efflux RND transporter permease subunit [Brackiella oedipodis]